jgi:hypothetical protein
MSGEAAHKPRASRLTPSLHLRATNVGLHKSNSSATGVRPVQALVRTHPAPVLNASAGQVAISDGQDRA